nr:cytochrome c [Pedobacter panaciterrae]
MKQVLMVILILTISGVTSHAQKKAEAKKTVKTEVISAAVFANGQKVYNKYCLSCHMADGGGVQNMNPPLIKTTYVLGDKTQLIKIALNGLNEEIEIDGEVYNNVMPSHGFLKDQEIADVLTFVRNSFGNKASAIKVSEVKAVRAEKK